MVVGSWLWLWKPNTVGHLYDKIFFPEILTKTSHGSPIRYFVTSKSWWHHQMETFSALLAICAGNSAVTDEFPSQRPVTWNLMFSLIYVWINGWVDNRKARDLRCHFAHYDITVMIWNHVILDHVVMAPDCTSKDHLTIMMLQFMAMSLICGKPFITWSNDDQVIWCHMALINQNDSTHTLSPLLPTL